MIQDKKTLKLYLNYDKQFYFKNKRGLKILLDKLSHEYLMEIWKFVKYLRYEEYYYNTIKAFSHKLKFLIYRRKKSIQGIKLGLSIPKNTCGYGLMICHNGSIVINSYARIGNFAMFHGNNCIGNINNDNNLVPTIGNNCDFGFGSCVIGKTILGDNIIIGANSVINKSFPSSSTICGIPGKVINKK